MHEANFELIEIPHVRQSGKNSADIRLVVDALDLCYTKSHVDTFVIISGDSDFSPLVSKLRENAKQVIGVGVKQSCSDLLIANCDEFIYYDDLVRDRDAQQGRRPAGEPGLPPRRTPEEEAGRKEEMEARKTKAVELAAATFADLIAVRGDGSGSGLPFSRKRSSGTIRVSTSPLVSGTFGNLLEAANRGLLGFGRDEKIGGLRDAGAGATAVTEAPPAAPHPPAATQEVAPRNRWRSPASGDRPTVAPPWRSPDSQAGSSGGKAGGRANDRCGGSDGGRAGRRRASAGARGHRQIPAKRLPARASRANRPRTTRWIALRRPDRAGAPGPGDARSRRRPGRRRSGTGARRVSLRSSSAYRAGPDGR